MRELAGRVAVITGAASGIGRGMALAFARAGMSTVVTDVDVSGVQIVAEEAAMIGPRSLAMSVDVTDPNSLEACAEKTWAEFGACHLLCNNAGVAVARPIHETNEEDWRWTLRVNLWGVVNGFNTFLPRLKLQGGPAHIVNTASMSGHLPTPLLTAYTATKYAVVGLSECLAIELADEPIGISVLCPGAVKTRIGDAGRNRPQGLGPDVPIPDGIRETLAQGMDAERVGEIVRQAVEEDEFWIFTHPGMKPILDARHDAIASAMDRWKERLA